MAMEWNPTTGRAMETTAAAGTAPQPDPTMYRNSAVMPAPASAPMYQAAMQPLQAQLQANMSGLTNLQDARLAEMNKASSLAPVPGMETISRPLPDGSRDIAYGISPIEMGGAGRYMPQQEIDLQAKMQSQMEAMRPQIEAAKANPQPKTEIYQTGALGSVAKPAVLPTPTEPRQFQTMIGQAPAPQAALQQQQEQQKAMMNANALLGSPMQENAPQGPSTQPPAPQGNAYGKGGTQPQAQPQGNAYGKGGMQQANPQTQAMSQAANLAGGLNQNQNAVNERMAGAMGSQAQAPAPQAPAPQSSNGKGGAMGGSPQMGGYTPPNNFSRPAPQQGGGKGGQVQQPAPPPSYSGGGKGGGGFRPTYQRPQRPTYGGKGG